MVFLNIYILAPCWVSQSVYHTYDWYWQILLKYLIISKKWVCQPKFE
jgi:hypothetical protein